MRSSPTVSEINGRFAVDVCRSRVRLGCRHGISEVPNCINEGVVRGKVNPQWYRRLFSGGAMLAHVFYHCTALSSGSVLVRAPGLPKMFSHLRRQHANAILMDGAG